jgi:hypothetical protein
MINRNQNEIFTILNSQNKKMAFPQNKQLNLMNQKTKKSNSSKRPLTANINYNNRKIHNNIFVNQNLINNNENDELGKALLIIRRELKRKNDRILELENKVIKLTNILNRLINNKSNNINISSNINLFKSKIKGGNVEEENKKGGDIRANMEFSGLNNINNLVKNNIRSNNYIRSVSQNNNNYNSDNENIVKRNPGYDNLSRSNDNSVLTYNGVQTSSKKNVKNYLKEVKTRIEPTKFREFIRNIKLLTAKNNSALNKEIIIESVRILFGEENKDLFIKFKTIIGIGK